MNQDRELLSAVLECVKYCISQLQIIGICGIDDDVCIDHLFPNETPVPFGVPGALDYFKTSGLDGFSVLFGTDESLINIGWMPLFERDSNGS